MNRRGIAVSLVLLAFSVALLAREIPDSEARNHVGENVTVRGVVANAYKSEKGNTFLNFGDRYPKQILTAVVFRNRAHLFEDLQSLEGRTVRISGKIELYKGIPEIILERPDQLEVVGP